MKHFEVVPDRARKTAQKAATLKNGDILRKDVCFGLALAQDGSVNHFMPGQCKFATTPSVHLGFLCESGN
jgi:hypothetical protein